MDKRYWLLGLSLVFAIAIAQEFFGEGYVWEDTQPTDANDVEVRDRLDGMDTSNMRSGDYVLIINETTGQWAEYVWNPTLGVWSSGSWGWGGIMPNGQPAPDACFLCVDV